MFHKMVEVTNKEGILIVQCRKTEKLVFLISEQNFVGGKTLEIHHENVKQVLQAWGISIEVLECIDETLTHKIYWAEV